MGRKTFTIIMLAIEIDGYEYHKEDTAASVIRNTAQRGHKVRYVH